MLTFALASRTPGHKRRVRATANSLVSRLPTVFSRTPFQILSRSRRLISCKPSGGRELGDPIDWEVSQARQDRARIVANRDLKPPAGFDYRDNGCNARSGLLASDVDPVAASQGDRAHRVLSQVIGQLQFGIFQETSEPHPKRQRVVASLRQNALWQCV